jgi:hypothetical protein
LRSPPGVRTEIVTDTRSTGRMRAHAQRSNKCKNTSSSSSSSLTKSHNNTSALVALSPPPPRHGEGASGGQECRDLPAHQAGQQGVAQRHVRSGRGETFFIPNLFEKTPFRMCFVLGCQMVTWTMPADIDWCLRPYGLLGLSLHFPGGVTRLVTWTIPAVINRCFDCKNKSDFAKCTTNPTSLSRTVTVCSAPPLTRRTTTW